MITPFGLEVVHLRDHEEDPVDNVVLGPRRHVRIAMHYCKPCIVSTAAKLARGGHYAQFSDLVMPEGLYLFHLKYCDYGQYSTALDRRNAMVADIAEDDPKKVMVGKHWFAQSRQDDAIFDSFQTLPREDSFDFSTVKSAMAQTWRPRGTDGMWQFDCHEADRLHVLPKRFHGII